MSKQFLIQLTMSSLVGAGVFQAQAQTVVWGAGHPNSTIDSIGRFAKPTATVDSMGLHALGWSVDTMTCGARWEWYADGQLPPGTLSADNFIPQSIGSWLVSPSIADGCAMFASEVWENDAQGAPWIGQGPCPVYPNDHSVSIYSPLIDLSGYVDSALQIDFHVSYLDFVTEPHSVGISTNGGNDWTDIEYSLLTGGVGVRSLYNGAASVYLPDSLFAGVAAADLDSCQIRFSYEGIFYFLAIDDVSLKTVDPNLAYDITYAPSTQEYGYVYAYNPMDFYATPLSQITAPNSGATGEAAYQSYVVGAYAYNNGHEAIPTSLNPRVVFDIQYDQNGTWVSQHMDSIAYNHDIGTYDTATLNGVNINDEMRSIPITGFQPTKAGNYRIVYRLTHDGVDANLQNNEAIREFQITDEWYSMVSLDTNGSFNSDYSLNPGSMSGSDGAVEFEAGNLFYFNAGNRLFVDSIRYLINAGTGFNTNYNGNPFVVAIRLYKWTSAQDLDSDGQADFSEYVLTTQANDTITVSGTGLYQREISIYDPTVINPVTGRYDHPYILEDNALYFVSIYQSTALQVALQGGDGDLVDEANEFPNCFYVRANWVNHQGFFRFGYASTIGGLLSSGGFDLGTGDGKMTSGFSNRPAFAGAIALKTTDIAPEVDVNKVTEIKGNFEVFPNPATTSLTTKVDLETPSSSVRYIVTDLTGRVMTMETRKNVQNDLFTVEVKNYPAGVYFVHIKTDAGSISKRFVKK